MNLSERFLETAARQRDKVAIYFGADRSTYDELRRKTLAFARALRQDLGIQKGDRIGLCMQNRPEFVPALFGALQAGAVVVPINHFFKADELGYIVDDAGLQLLVSDDPTSGIVAEVRSTRPGLRHWRADDFASLSMAEEPFESPGLSTDDLALLVYTSGTTGRPKGAMLSQGNLLHNVESCRQILEIIDLDRFVLALPMFHSFMLTVCILLPLLTGGAIVLIKSLQSPKAMLAELISGGGSVLPAMAQLFRALSGVPAGLELPLRLCICGAGPLPDNIRRAFSDRFPVLPLIEGYGLSEASPVVSVNPVRGPWIPGTIGVPIPGVELSVQDESGCMVPELTDGEICVRGGNVMRGYWNQPVETAAVLRDGWLLTGDLGHRRPDGYYVITERKKDMLKPNGMNVYPREIEDVITQFDGIQEAAVIGEPDERRGERPVAFVAMQDGVALDEKALLGFLKERLADYKLPRRAIQLPSLPRNATGKVLKTRLRDLLHASVQAS